MPRPTLATATGPAPYGLGVALGALGGHDWYGHGGSIPGFDAFVATFPADGLTIAVVANVRPFDSEGVARSIARALLGVPAEGVREVALSAGERARFVGTYRVAGGGALRIVEVDDVLRLTGPGDFQLLYQGDGVLVAREEPEIRLEMVVEGGEVTGLVYTAPGRRYEMRRDR